MRLPNPNPDPNQGCIHPNPNPSPRPGVLALTQPQPVLPAIYLSIHRDLRLRRQQEVQHPVA